MSISSNDYAFHFLIKNGYYYINKERDSNDSEIIYYAFGDKFGNKYLMKTKESCDSGYARYYVTGPTSDFEAVWAMRESLGYRYPWEMFNNE